MRCRRGWAYAKLKRLSELLRRFEALALKCAARHGAMTREVDRSEGGRPSKKTRHRGDGFQPSTDDLGLHREQRKRNELLADMGR